MVDHLFQVVKMLRLSEFEHIVSVFFLGCLQIVGLGLLIGINWLFLFYMIHLHRTGGSLNRCSFPFAV
jgi:hypothetical protein